MPVFLIAPPSPPTAVHRQTYVATEHNNSLLGQSAVVTGSSSGIGRAIALELARAGADVLVHARQNRAGAEEVAAEIRAVGRTAQVVLADLAKPAEQDHLVEEAWRWRTIDAWINNAGVDVLTGPAASWTFEEKLAALWQVDVAATLRLSRAVGRRMKERGHGVILNMGWDQAATGMGGDSGELFGSTKGAVMAATLSLAQSLAPEVRVNCLAPGWIRTDWGSGASQYWDERAKQDSLARRWGEPEDVAHVACFLASPTAAFVNGQIIPINGGRSYRQWGE
jgi:NAD(P)-dependent dehydrogenase (short-subunit alcohol dehydrogenase family)